MLLTLALVVPLALALVVAWRPTRTAGLAAAPWAALPALALAAVGEPGPAHADWLLLGARLDLDTTARVFLRFSAVLWLLAGIYAQSYLAGDRRRARFMAWFLVTEGAQFGLILAADMLTFYVCFAVMSFASYPLVVHTGDRAAVDAARIYIVLVILGELVLFTGIMATAALAGRVDLAGAPAAVAATSAGPFVMALLFIGFGIKAGALPLHVWLPLAHPAAPTPASAVLSGALIKAGLLGWLRFLPPGDVALPLLGSWCLVAGVVAAFAGVLAGITQINPKSALAYSSISQMGFLTVGLGAGLMVPDAWPLLLPALLLYAAHHGLAKGALFLGVGVAAAVAGQAARRAVLAAMLVPALALAGAPLTTGAAAKTALKYGLAEASVAWPPGLGGTIEMLLSLAAVGTTLLMARVLVLLAAPAGAHGRAGSGLIVSWGLLVAVVGVAAWLPGTALSEASRAALAPAAVWAAAWPAAAGLALAGVALSSGAAAVWRARLFVPPGDVLWLAAGVWRAGVRVVGRVPVPRVAGAGDAMASRLTWRADLPAMALRMEQGLTAWTTAGAALVIVTAVLAALLWRG